MLAQRQLYEALSLPAMRSTYLFLYYFDTQTFAIQIGQRDDVVVGLDYVTFVSLK